MLDDNSSGAEIVTNFPVSVDCSVIVGAGVWYSTATNSLSGASCGSSAGCCSTGTTSDGAKTGRLDGDVVSKIEVSPTSDVEALVGALGSGSRAGAGSSLGADVSLGVCGTSGVPLSSAGNGADAWLDKSIKMASGVEMMSGLVKSTIDWTPSSMLERKNLKNLLMPSSKLAAKKDFGWLAAARLDFCVKDSCCCGLDCRIALASVAVIVEILMFLADLGSWTRRWPLVRSWRLTSRVHLTGWPPATTADVCFTKVFLTIKAWSILCWGIKKLAIATSSNMTTSPWVRRKRK